MFIFSNVLAKHKLKKIDPKNVFRYALFKFYNVKDITERSYFLNKFLRYNCSIAVINSHEIGARR